MPGVRTAGCRLPSVRRVARAKEGKVRTVPRLFQLAHLRIHQWDPTLLGHRISALTDNLRHILLSARGRSACPTWWSRVVGGVS